MIKMTNFDIKLLSLLLLALQCISSQAKDTSFDVLILTQHWPYTTCMDWKERSKENSCRIPTDATWSLHGLWPNRWGEIAPGFCDESATFNVSLLEPITTKMQTYWPDVEIRKKKNSLWEHEYLKHGTCAAQLPVMDSELKYFATGCELGKANPITSWLEVAGVVPGASYDIGTVFDAVVAGTKGARPHIDCDYVEGEHYISEIKICLNKNLTLVNCDGIHGTKKHGGKAPMGTCPHHKEFVYPGKDNNDGQAGDGIIAVSIGGCFLILVVLMLVGVLIWKSGHSYRARRAYEAL